MKNFKSLHIYVIGCGKLGSYLANRFSHGGHSVVVIDENNKSFEKLSVHFSGFRIEGDATELQVLKQAKVDKADLLLATTDDDNINLMVAQVARKIFKVPRVMARVYIPGRENIYREMGVDTICPTTVIGDLVSDIYVEEFSGVEGERTVS
jgi:trk system potassium uptake protein